MTSNGQSAGVTSIDRAPPARVENITHLREISRGQWKAAFAAWIGLLFDGLDAYLYVLVATPFVAELLHVGPKDPSVTRHGAFIQAAFLIGWAGGGTVFGWMGDRFGRARTMSWTILLYAMCTGLSAAAQQWWHLLFFRFLVGLGIGGEWAAGSALISETWPRHWRPWVSASLWSAYEVGMLGASLASGLFASHPRLVFLVGAFPAFGVYWIRRSVPEPDEWHAARARAKRHPRIGELFTGDLARTTLLTTCLCSLAITTAWLFLYFYPQQLRNLPDLRGLTEAARTRYISSAFLATTVAALVGNFAFAWVAKRFGYRFAVTGSCCGSMIALLATYAVPHGAGTIIVWLSITNFFVLGIFGLFPLYIPPLFPTLLRTTGAGFSYNVGRVVSALGLVVFGLLMQVGDYGRALMSVALLYVPQVVIALMIPEHRDIQKFTAANSDLEIG